VGGKKRAGGRIVTSLFFSFSRKEREGKGEEVWRSNPVYRGTSLSSSFCAARKKRGREGEGSVRASADLSYCAILGGGKDGEEVS